MLFQELFKFHISKFEKFLLEPPWGKWHSSEKGNGNVKPSRPPCHASPVTHKTPS